MTARRLPSLCALGATLAAPLHVAAAEIGRIDLRIEDERYLLRSECLLEAAPERVFQILLDYENFHRLAGGIAESRLLEPDSDGTALGYTRIESCVLFFCKRLEKVERIYPQPPDTIVTEALPELSDFRLARTRWTLEPTDTGTRIRYALEMEPDFWIPPLIGPWAIKRKLRRSALRIAQRIEYIEASGIPLSEFDPSAAPD